MPCETLPCMHSEAKDAASVASLHAEAKDVVFLSPRDMASLSEATSTAQPGSHSDSSKSDTKPAVTRHDAVKAIKAYWADLCDSSNTPSQDGASQVGSKAAVSEEEKSASRTPSESGGQGSAHSSESRAEGTPHVKGLSGRDKEQSFKKSQQEPRPNAEPPPNSGQGKRTKKGKRGKRRKRRGPLRIAECLEKLANYDPDCVLRCSRLGLLGDDRWQTLTEFLERHGSVSEIIPATGSCPEEPYARLVFVVMSSAEEAERVPKGEEVSVTASAIISIRPFEANYL